MTNKHELNFEKVRPICRMEKMEKGSPRWALHQLVAGLPLYLKEHPESYYAMLTDCTICKFTYVDGTWVSTVQNPSLFTGEPGLLKFLRYSGPLYNGYPNIGETVELKGNPVRIMVESVTMSGSVTGTILGTKAKLTIKFGEYKVVKEPITQCFVPSTMINSWD